MHKMNHKQTLWDWLMGTPMILNAWFESDVSVSCASYISMVLTMDN